jgi:hypothetical protein
MRHASGSGSGEEGIRRIEAQTAEAKARLAELAQRPPAELIEAYRANSSRNLFGPQRLSDDDTVSVGVVNREPVFGVNSGSAAYTPDDRFVAGQTVSTLAGKYP